MGENLYLLYNKDTKECDYQISFSVAKVVPLSDFYSCGILVFRDSSVSYVSSLYNKYNESNVHEEYTFETFLRMRHCDIRFVNYRYIDEVSLKDKTICFCDGSKIGTYEDLGLSSCKKYISSIRNSRGNTVLFECCDTYELIEECRVANICCEGKAYFNHKYSYACVYKVKDNSDKLFYILVEASQCPDSSSIVSIHTDFNECLDFCVYDAVRASRHSNCFDDVARERLVECFK
jgi:hypothetical protein